MKTDREIAQAATGNWDPDEIGIVGPDGFVITVQLPEKWWGAHEDDVPAEVLAKNAALYDFLARFNPKHVLELLEERDRNADDIQELYAALYKAWPHAEDMGDGSAKGVGHLIEQLTEERDGLLEALTEITGACEEDCGIPSDCDQDDEAVGAGEDGDMALTFGMLRRASAAIARAKGEGQ